MIEKILLLLLVVFAVLAIQHKHVRIAAIYLGVFSLLCSVAYLYCAAPDVALAEAVIGSTLLTVLYLVALKQQESKKGSVGALDAGYWTDYQRRRWFHGLAGVFIVILGVLFMYLYRDPGVDEVQELANHYRHRFIDDTGAKNAVTAIYLNYRVFDTFFETLTLQVSVMGVIYFSHHKLHAPAGSLKQINQMITFPFNKDRQITCHIIRFVFPFIFILGAAIILNGHLTPGGGFQGGAVLSAVLITRYMILPVNDLRQETLLTLEKVMFVLIILVPLLYLIYGLNQMIPALNVPYLVLMNSLIGIKVCCGISILFIRFAFYESR